MMTPDQIKTDHLGFKYAYIKAPANLKRDANKTFLISEWTAERAETWGLRALFAYNRGGGEVPVADIMGRGMEGIFWLGVNTFLRGQMKAEEVQPILNELLECVKIVRDPGRNEVGTGKPIAHDLMPQDIFEIQTRYWLRSEVLELHTGFSVLAVASRLISAAMATEDTSNIQTSLPLSD
jgi:hypothetical protein